MSSSQGKLTHTEVIKQEVLNVTTTQAEQFSHRQQIFELMDSLLSFEACLYHQILPLRLAEKNLLLGMVYPHDTEALNYVNRILSYINSKMVIEAIAIADHRTMLSAYLNYKNTLRPEAQKRHQSRVEFINKSVNTNSQSSPPPILIAESPESPTPSVDSSRETATIVTPVQHSPETTPEQTKLPNNLTTLPAQHPDTLSPIEVLPTLPPKKLLQELLGRFLAGGIGRLYLERQPYQGRILWSDNGVLQSVIENLPLSLLQGVLNELKRFAGLPITTIAEPRQVEKEYLYQKNRVLLRLRVMPGLYGEEATLQVLRGAALKFYQQQQLGHVSREALNVAQQLNSKLYELQQRLVLNPNLPPEQLDALIALHKLVENLDQQITAMTASIQTDNKIT